MDQHAGQRTDTHGNLNPSGDYGLLEATGCKSLSVGPDWRIGSVFTQPTSQLGEAEIWDSPAGTDSINVVFKRRDAEATGNRDIAMAGFLGAVAIGIMPVAIEALRRWLRSRRAHATSSADAGSNPSPRSGWTSVAVNVASPDLGRSLKNAPLRSYPSGELRTQC